MVLVLNNMGVATVFILTCMCVVPLRGQKPGQVDPLKAHRANLQCWEASSALLLEMRSPRIADTVPAFWDLMESLRASNNSKHTALFWDLAQVFWDIYLDCIVSRSHGLGRRHITAVQSLITDNDGGHNGGPDSQSFVVEQEKTTQVIGSFTVGVLSGITSSVWNLLGDSSSAVLKSVSRILRIQPLRSKVPRLAPCESET